MDHCVSHGTSNIWYGHLGVSSQRGGGGGVHGMSGIVSSSPGHKHVWFMVRYCTVLLSCNWSLPELHWGLEWRGGEKSTHSSCTNAPLRFHLKQCRCRFFTRYLLTVSFTAGLCYLCHLGVSCQQNSNYSNRKYKRKKTSKPRARRNAELQLCAKKISDLC